MIIEPNAELRAEIAAALHRAFDELELVEVGRFSDAHAAVCDHLNTDMVFIACDSPTRQGVNVAQEIKSMNPALRVILMSATASPVTLQGLGLDGFLGKEEFAPSEHIQKFVNAYMGHKALG